MVARFPGWIAPLGAGGVAATATAAQTVFQIQPSPAPGTAGIHGGDRRPAAALPQYPGAVDATWCIRVRRARRAGARITAVTFDGRTVELFNEPGQFGLKRMIDAAAKKRKDGGVFELRWTRGEVAVAVDLKIISSAETTGARSASAVQEQGFRGMRLPETDRRRAAMRPPRRPSPPLRRPEWRHDARAAAVRLGYFGKIPARGDFIKAGDNHALVQLLDDWLAQVMTAPDGANRAGSSITTPWRRCALPSSARAAGAPSPGTW